MVQTGQITFYTHLTSPFCERVHMALEEAGAKYNSVPINLREKPAWYTQNVNPYTGRVPALTYGGPDHPPEEPSPEAVKLTESLVICELLADIFPESGLFPKDPIKRAEVRLFISIVDNKFFEGFKGFIFRGQPAQGLLDGMEAIQRFLPDTGFAVGEWSLADIVVVPLLARIQLLLENEIGKYPLGEGKKVLEALAQPKFARLANYIRDVRARPSFQAAYNEVMVLNYWKQSPVLKRD